MKQNETPNPADFMQLGEKAFEENVHEKLRETLSPNEKQMWISGYLLALIQQIKKETKNPIERLSATNIMENTNLNNEQVKNPLRDPLNHSLEDLLKEIQFGRPAETQLQIQKWIDELKNK
jgi:hypothetical protein